MPGSSLGSSLQIRKVHEVEWAEYRDLRLRALREDPLAFGSTLERERQFPEPLWRQRLANPDSSSWVAVASGDHFVGMAVAAKVEGEYHIFGMWVAPDHRGKGAGGRLLDAAIAWIRESSPNASILLEVNPRQEAAVQLYRSRGFGFTGRTTSLDHSPCEKCHEMVRSGLKSEST